MSPVLFVLTANGEAHDDSTVASVHKDRKVNFLEQWN